MTRYRIYPYRQFSASARALAVALGGKVLKREGSTFVAQAGDVIVNWGDVSPPTFCTSNTGYIKSATNKLLFMKLMTEKGLASIVPAYWETKDAIPDDAYPVVCRQVLAGHSGAGIVIAQSSAELVDAPLYVRYMKKKEEYRIHVGKKRIPQVSLDVLGNPDPEIEYVVIASQQKARRSDVPTSEVNWQIRNHQNGFIYKRHDINPPAIVLDYARQALAATDLDFGAVDVIYNVQEGKAYVLEINTAPGLEGTTVTDYAEYFKGDQ